jgi:hypothetical protein
MKALFHGAVVLLVAAGLAAPCWGQRGIPIPRVAPAPVHFPVHVPHGSNRGGGGIDVDPLTVILGIAGVVGAGVAVALGIRAWRNRAIAYVRITHTPPGEAPEEIRRAWVGVELPLRRAEVEPQQLPTVGAVSNQGWECTTGYIVDGRTAVRCLASHSPDAALWWRENAPHVVASGYRLCFPSAVCERLG